MAREPLIGKLLVDFDLVDHRPYFHDFRVGKFVDHLFRKRNLSPAHGEPDKAADR